ncbi:C-myc promoter-binding protein-like isoform X2 [Clavelina lepadiformis]|uniref:C-myc promoter-binding protein-like isoform X2 n=1 Tax=Clavelina lepadiformis TaxID=159417 RepID=UPI004042105C
MSSEDYPKVAEYFVVAGLTESSQPLEEDLAFPNANHKLSDQKKDPITDICVINKTLEENCPQGFTCIEQTPSGFFADLNHGSLTAPNILLCYRRGKDKPPLIDLGVYYEGLETVRSGISILETTPAGRSANVNNKSGMGSHPIYLTYRRAKDSAPQNSLVVTDICIILTNKGERTPYAFCQIEKNLNKGLIGSSVHLCYKKSMRQVDSISFKAGFMGRYPSDDSGSFSLPATVPLFCLPMGATVECWSSKTKHPLPTFSSFVLTTETSEKVFGAVVSFYESYPEDKLSEQEKFKLGVLRGDGQRSRATKTIHTNKAICLLSRWPMFNVFRDFLMYLYRMTVSPIAHPVPVERHIAHFIHNIPFPTSARPRVQYQMSPMHLTILTRPQITPIPLSGASFLALLDDLGPENTIALIVLALTEHKIVIHSLRPAEITCVAEALITLLFPFKWQCTYVPLCPLEMAYVLEAPTPFIVGVDSRYFDLYEPPSDVACVNLDTNSITLLEEKKHISWKLLPRKPAKLLRSTLQRYFKEVKECPREESVGFASSSILDPELTRTERHRQLELAIQEAVLKLMASLMKGYRQYLLPITEAPGAGTTDPGSLFNIQEFLRSRDRASQRFFSAHIGTQLFSSFIEERSLTSIGGGEVAAGRLSSLVFFDECIDRIGPEHAVESVKLIEADDSLKSEHTVMIMPPDETGLPPGVGYQYTTFPELQDELFVLDEPESDQDQRNGSLVRKRRKSDTFTFGRRTKQEVRTLNKISKLHSGDSRLWARLLLSHTYGAWFACLPAFVVECRHKDAALRTAHDALRSLKDKNCTPLPDETYYRMLFHLCAVYNKPALAVRLFQFVRKTGTQLSAITYGLYNKAVLEGTWPASNRDGYMLWLKLRNVFLAVNKFRYGIRRQSTVLTGSDVSSDFETASNTSVESQPQVAEKQSEKTQSLPSSPKVEDKTSAKKQRPLLSNADDDRKSTGGQSDHGYSSMPKDQVRRGSAHTNIKSHPNKKTTAKNASETDALIKSSDDNGTVSGKQFEHITSSRSIQPPRTLNILASNGIDVAAVTDPGLKSDETLVNGETGDHFLLMPDSQINKDDISPHRPRSSPVSPGLHRKLGHARSIVKSTSSDGGSFSDGEDLSPPECPFINHDGDDNGVECSQPSYTCLSLPACGVTNNGVFQAVLVNGDSDVHTVNGTGSSLLLAPAILSNHKLKSIAAGKLHGFSVIKSSEHVLNDEVNLTEELVGLGDSTTNVKCDVSSVNLKQTTLPPVIEVTDNHTIKSAEKPAQNTCESKTVDITGLTSPMLSPAANDDVFHGREDHAQSSKDTPKSQSHEEKVVSADTRTPKMFSSASENLLGSSCISNSSGSPATPEMTSLFGGDSKFLLSLSDSDQKRYQELCSHRPSSSDPDNKDRSRSTRHGSLMLSSSHLRGRSSTALGSSTGVISPLIGQNCFSGGSQPNTPTARPNFDRLTAEDLGSPAVSNILGARSGSGSILMHKRNSPSRLLGTSGSPSHRKSSRKMAGSNTLAIVDGVAMLTSTPLKPVVEPQHNPLVNANEKGRDSTPQANKQTEDLILKPTASLKSKDSQKKKQPISRQDISNLAEDPLSPLSDKPAHPLATVDANHKTNGEKSNSLSRHLVDEIEDYLQKDALVRCSSDATLTVHQQERIAKSNENLSETSSEQKLHRKNSLPSHSPTTQRKNASPPTLQRSTTFHNDHSESAKSWFGSGSRLNSLLKATTYGMATKAKKVATNFAKDLNETMQASLSYYTPEKVKGSLSDLSFRSSQDDLSKGLSDALSSKKHLLDADHYSSQSSLRSCESIHSAMDINQAQADKVSRRVGGKKSRKKLDRPLSMPHFDSSSSARAPAPPLASSSLSVPGGATAPDLNITASMTSLNSKATYDVEVTISSCSKCHKCDSLVYDEEIMAGWIPDESNLNTHCPFCNSLFVPFLNIEIKDYRLSHQRSSLHLFKASSPQKSDTTKDNLLSPVVETYAGTHNLPLTPDLSQPVQEDTKENNKSSSEIDNVGLSDSADAILTPPPTPNANPTSDNSSPTTQKELPAHHSIDPLRQNSETSDLPSSPQKTGETTDNISESLSVDASEVQSLDGQSIPMAPIELEPVTVPYLSSLVLRKELESLLENEGTTVLNEPGFVDHHPIIYWNLVWYFRRLNLHSNLYNLLLQSQLVLSGSNKSLSISSQSQNMKSTIIINLMWDNLKLHDSAEKPPLYCVWHQIIVQGMSDANRSYSNSFLENIKESIMQDDVRGPLVAVLNELRAQQGLRRSAYREILYLVIIALGKASIDVDAFDREYERAYKALTKEELLLTEKCDRPPSNHAMDCRGIFGDLDLYK